MTGYEFERNIQESGAGQYTRAFRECAPSSTTFPAGGGPPATIPQPPRLTDGLVLRDKWQAGDSQVAALLAQIESDDQQRRQNGQPALAPVVTVALGMLEDAIDAVADALTAESVHHAIAGVAGRAAATLDALARGDGSVPELDFLTSPRHGLTLGHRVAFAVPANVGRQPGWSAPSSNQSRAAANPTLEGLVETWLPDPREVRCTATATPASGTAQTAVVHLSDCDLSALDCLYETPTVPTDSGSGGVPDRITLAVIEATRTKLGLNPATSVAVNWDRTADFGRNELTFTELGTMCGHARELVQGSRALRPADLAALSSIPGRSPRAGFARRWQQRRELLYYHGRP